MKENPIFVGPVHEGNDKDEKVEELRSWSEESSKTLEGEPEKTEEEIKLIDMVNSLIGSELTDLGIEGYEPLPMDRIHILPDEVFKSHFPNSTSHAFFRATNDAVYINKSDAPTKAHLVYLLTHELIHRASTIKFYADDADHISEARVGYRIRSSWKENDRVSRLSGFNELMNDMTVFLIFRKNQELLEKDMGIAREEIKGPIYSYLRYIPIIQKIIEKVSVDKGISIPEAFRNFERGQFASNILVLKDVERSFGKGALEVLSFFGTLKNKEDNEKLDEMINGYFAEVDASKRQLLGIEINKFVNESMQTSKTE